MSDTTNQIPLNPNLNCLIQNFLYFLKCQGEVATRMQKEKKSIGSLSNVSSSMHSYLTYRKRIHSRLSQINTNISNTIIEGCRGIDTICYKVRQCLSENQCVERSSCSNNNESETNKLKRNSDGFLEVSSIEECVQDNQCEQPVQPDIKEIRATASIASLSVNEATQTSWEHKVAKKLSTAKMKRQIRKRNLILEEFRQTVMDHIEHNDFEAMGRIVENLNEDIENFDKTVYKDISEVDTEILRAQTMDVQESRPVLISKEEVENFEVAMAQKRARLSVIPEVFAKASVTDLHKKLIAQLEANDSFLCFQRIMERQKVNKKRPVTPTSVVCSSSSVSSTVSRRKRKKSRASNSQSEVDAPRQRPGKGVKSEMKILENVRSELYAKYSDSLWFSQRYLGKGKTSQSSVKSKRNSRERQKTAKTERHKTNTEPKIIRKERNHRTKRAHKATSKSSSITHSDATISLSRCTNSGYSCNLSINNDLPVSLSTKCHLRWIKARNDQAPTRKIEYLDILDDLTPKDLLPLQSEYPRRDRQGGVKFFFDLRPREGLHSNKSIKDTYLYRLLRESSKQTTWEHLLKPSIECCDYECPLCRSKQGIFTPDNTEKTAAQKLLPYMRDPTTDHLHFQSVTVMPVRVFYDDHQHTYRVAEGAGNSVEQKPRPALMKEAKGAVRAKWVDPNQEPTKTLRMVYAGPAKLQQSETKTAASKHSSQQILSRRNSKPFSPREKNKLEKYIKVQSDIEKMSTEIQSRTPKGFERKLWANKYGKSVGHQLVSFVKNQPQELKPVLPKYALPNGPRVIKSTTRHKQMLAHLKGLKQKNDEIQTNIQKAINVIETKMIDILSAPGDSSSVEAFDLMEKEITNVLSMMKFSSKSSSRNPTPKTAEILAPSPPSKKVDKLEEDFNSISDLLFKKLEKILDSDKSRPTTSASESDKKDEEVHRKKQKVRKSLEAEKYLSSLTSTSVDDSDHRISNEKTSPNKRSKFGRCSMSAQERIEQPLTLVKIEKEYATGENCAIESTIFAGQDHEATDNSRGDCIEKICISLQEEQGLRIMKEKKDEGIREKLENCETAEETPVSPEIVTEQPQEEKSKIPPKSDDDDSEVSDPSFSDQVNKIIKRVEDVYNHLDDIHTSNNNNNKDDGEMIPVFTEPPEVPGVASQQFLTPFMQAVKEKRSQSLQRSPSYYNVLTFLDTLSTIQQQEKTIEVHFVRLCHFSRSIFFAEVFRVARFEHTAKMEMAGCLRKHNSDEGKTKHKRVSFLVLKENKMCQASICHHHQKVRALKVSSEQFPMSEGDKKLQVSDSDHSINNYSDQELDRPESSEISIPDGPPQIQVFYERFPTNEPPTALEGFYSHQTILQVKKYGMPEFRPKPKIAVFREVSGMLQPLKGLDRFSRDDLSVKQELVVVNSEKGHQNVVLLKSFYAFVYIIMFTAMNLDYRCA